MPTRERVQQFIAAVESGAHVEAIRDFYVEGATMRENGAEPRRGRDTLMQHEANVLQRVQNMRTHPAQGFTVDGDRVAIHWVFDSTSRKGDTYRIDEIAWQRWDGDRIAEERFFYDSAAAKTPIDPGTPL